MLDTGCLMLDGEEEESEAIEASLGTAAPTLGRDGWMLDSGGRMNKIAVEHKIIQFLCLAIGKEGVKQ